jgi:hypothetical protein
VATNGDEGIDRQLVGLIFLCKRKDMRQRLIGKSVEADVVRHGWVQDTAGAKIQRRPFYASPRRNALTPKIQKYLYTSIFGTPRRAALAILTLCCSNLDPERSSRHNCTINSFAYTYLVTIYFVLIQSSR